MPSSSCNRLQSKIDDSLSDLMSSKVRSDEDELRAALQVEIARLCTQDGEGTTMTKSAIQTLTELTYLYATTTLANDLVAFSHHANRRTINPDDVLLVARKNEDLLKGLKDLGSATNSLATNAPVFSRSASSSKPSKPNLFHSIAAPSKGSPLALDSSSSASSPTTSRARIVRKRRAIDRDSEVSSPDGAVPLIPAKKVKGTDGVRASTSYSNKDKVSMGSSKRKFIDSTDDEEEEAKNAKRKQQPTAWITKRASSEVVSALYSSSEDDSVSF